jgi:beta-lactam-binding protein with PASTA domain
VALAAAWALALLLLVGGGLIAPRVISRDAAAPVAAGTSMPALTGMSFAEALDTCAKQGIYVERVDVVYGPGPLNQVVDQTPAPGQALHDGDTVSLVVRTGR